MKDKIDLDKTITLRELLELCKSIDAEWGIYPEHHFEGAAVFEEILYKLFPVKVKKPDQCNSYEEIDACVLHPVHELMDQMFNFNYATYLRVNKRWRKAQLAQRGI